MQFTKIVPVIALLTGATVWGLIWYPYRVLADAGINAAWATLLTYGGALVLAVIFLRPRLRLSWMLLAIALTAGWANVSFTLGVVYGDVMRVVLLFYLSPLWTILFARWILGERLAPAGYGLMLLALAGAAVMLWQPRMGWPLPASAAEWMGASAGAMFALSNVLIRKTARLSIESKVVAVFLGGIVMSAIGVVVLPSAPAPLNSMLNTAWLLTLLSMVLLAVNVAVQHGLTHISANRAIVIYLFELVVTAFAAWLLAGEVLSVREWCGGLMIIGAGLLSDRLGPDAVTGVSARSETAAAPRS